MGSDLSDHFCAFVAINGQLVEFDGSAEEEPVWHGPTSPERFLSDVALVVKAHYMALAPESNAFNIMALHRKVPRA